MKQEYDYIIVGQGLAGTCLALELVKLEQRLLLIDSPSTPSSSRIAGGLINPITGRNMVLTWLAHQLFPKLTSFYKHYEKQFETSFFFSDELYRPFSNIEEMNEWMGKSSEDYFKPFVKYISESPQNTDRIINPYAGICFNYAGRLDVNVFLNSANVWLNKKEAVLSEVLDHDKLNFKDGNVVYKDCIAKGVIFCNGVHAEKDGLFNWIPFMPVKGEVLTLELEKNLDKIYNKGIFSIPTGNKKHIVGSNYDHNDREWKPTTKAKEQILNKFEMLIKDNYKVVKHAAGIRPAVVDRRPVLGRHPEIENAYLFNGLGTKGVSLAPYFSEKMANYLVFNEELNNEVNIKRFFRYFE